MASSSGSGSGETRLKSYKTNRLTLEESRKKREEEGIQLRKSKRDEQVRSRERTSLCYAYTLFLAVCLLVHWQYQSLFALICSCPRDGTSMLFPTLLKQALLPHSLFPRWVNMIKVCVLCAHTCLHALYMGVTVVLVCTCM